MSTEEVITKNKLEISRIKIITNNEEELESLFDTECIDEADN